jgi:hypothetical protein
METQHTKSMEYGQSRILRGNFKAISVHIRKVKRSHINNLSLHLKEPEK